MISSLISALSKIIPAWVIKLHISFIELGKKRSCSLMYLTSNSLEYSCKLVSMMRPSTFELGEVVCKIVLYALVLRITTCMLHVVFWAFSFQ